MNIKLIIRKSPFRLSPTRKANLRKRLRRVDDVIAAVAESGVETRSLSRAVALPKEHEMEARGELSEPRRQSLADKTDKYTTFSPHGRGFRKSVHKVPKWTKVWPIAWLMNAGLADIVVDIEGEPKRFLGYCTVSLHITVQYRIHHTILYRSCTISPRLHPHAQRCVLFKPKKCTPNPDSFQD